MSETHIPKVFFHLLTRLIILLGCQKKLQKIFIRILKELFISIPLEVQQIFFFSISLHMLHYEY